MVPFLGHPEYAKALLLNAKYGPLQYYTAALTIIDRLKLENSRSVGVPG